MILRLDGTWTSLIASTVLVLACGDSGNGSSNGGSDTAAGDSNTSTSESSDDYDYDEYVDYSVDFECPDMPEPELVYQSDDWGNVLGSPTRDNMLIVDGYLYFVDGSLNRIALDSGELEEFEIPASSLAYKDGTFFTAKTGSLSFFTDPTSAPEPVSMPDIDTITGNGSTVIAFQDSCAETPPGAIWSMDVDGTATEIPVGPTICVGAVAISDQHLYLRAFDIDDYEGLLPDYFTYQVPLSGGTPELLPIDGGSSYLVWADGYLFADAGLVHTTSLTRGLPSDDEFYSRIDFGREPRDSFRGSVLFMASSAPHCIGEIRGDELPVPLALSDALSTVGMVRDDTHVYWVTEDSSNDTYAIYRSPIP